jgi:hypothetical protein
MFGFVRIAGVRVFDLTSTIEHPAMTGRETMMSTFSINPCRRGFGALTALAILSSGGPLDTMAAEQPQASDQMHMSAAETSSPLVDKVRDGTARYTDINVAIAEGWVAATPCVSGPDTGAMGVHFVLPARIAAGVLNAEQPEALIYEPLPNGAMRLVGVEFIILASIWTTNNPGGTTPALDGNLLNYVGAPNRYGLPAFYELHVWAWQHNPKGTLADWNTVVSCEHQPLS